VSTFSVPFFFNNSTGFSISEFDQGPAYRDNGQTPIVQVSQFTVGFSGDGVAQQVSLSGY
jgi:hypothetical protein